MTTRRASILSALLLFVCLGIHTAAQAYTVTSPLGQEQSFTEIPRRVVTLYPTAAEILTALEKTDAIAGITLHDSSLSGLGGKPVVGGFAKPDMDKVFSLQPDLVIAAPLQAKQVEPLVKKGIPVLFLDTVRLADAPANIRCLGKVMNATDKAEEIIAREEAYQQLIAAKLARLAGRKPLRVMRLMAIFEDTLIVPGDDSFQNEMIRHAGGEAPRFDTNGQAIRIRPEQLRAFDPEYIYVGALDPAWVKERLGRPEWAGVSAIQNNKVLAFPRDLTSRAATHYGFFSMWLSAELHAKAFAETKNQAKPDAILSRKNIALPFTYVAKAEASDTRVFDFTAKTLTVRFKTPQQVLSSLDGWRDNVTVAGNHYSSPPSWPVTHYVGLAATNTRIMKLHGLQAKTSMFLYTGADMDKLAYAQAESDGMIAGVLVTAGVNGNAMRASVDTGRYVEPGTINVILMTNRRLTPAAMTRAIITATEAKTAVMEDLDIRSSYTGKAATGTGTDNVLVVAGDGPRATITGGHAKLGELIAKATYQAVREAVYKQNNIIPSRDIFTRLRERKIDITKFHNAQNPGLVPGIEQALLNPRYAGFLQAALAMSDSAERGLTVDTQAFSAWSLAIAGELVGKKVDTIDSFITDTAIAPLVREALNALATGIRTKQEK